MKNYLLTFDQGTTSCRAVIYDRNAQMISIAQREFKQYYPEPGWVEHDAKEIWGTMSGVAREAIEKAGVKTDTIAAIGMTNQRETTVLWDKETSQPICPAIVWQCRRSSEICEEWRSKGYENIVREKTGLTLDPYFSASKIRWILDHYPETEKLIAEDRLLFGTMDTWILWNLTRGKVHATDYTNASRTLLYNIHTLEWDEELLELFRIPKNILPEVHPSSHVFGYTDEKTYGGAEIPIAGILGDQQAALFGHCCWEVGEVKNTYGTGCFLLMNSGHEPMTSHHGLVTTIAWGLDDEVTYALEGSVFIAGAAIQWLRDEMELVKASPDTESIALEAPEDHGVTVIPAFTGLGAPYWNTHTRGAIFGITRGTNWKHIVRATLESIALQVMDVIKAMEEDANVPLAKLNVDGGASQNDFLMQFQADLLQKPVYKMDSPEITVLGAAYIAGLTVGFWKNRDEVKKLNEGGKWFTPQKDKAFSEETYGKWRHYIDLLLQEDYRKL